MIEFDIGGRQIGKTTRLLQWLEEGEAAKELRLLVTSSEREKERIQELIESKNYKLTEMQIVTMDDLVHLRGGPQILGVDNIDMVLAHFFHSPVHRVTATGINLAKVTE